MFHQTNIWIIVLPVLDEDDLFLASVAAEVEKLPLRKRRKWNLNKVRAATDGDSGDCRVYRADEVKRACAVLTWPVAWWKRVWRFECVGSRPWLDATLSPRTSRERLLERVIVTIRFCLLHPHLPLLVRYCVISLQQIFRFKRINKGLLPWRTVAWWCLEKRYQLCGIRSDTYRAKDFCWKTNNLILFSNQAVCSGSAPRCFVLFQGMHYERKRFTCPLLSRSCYGFSQN